MPQAEHELQLEVWKELAVSKQILMRTTASALKLDPNCSDEELREAVERLIRRTAEAEASAGTAREQARKAVADMERKLAEGIQARTAAETALAKMRAFKEKEGPQLTAERAAAAKELQKVKEQLAEKDKALKAINTALADKPENVLKKMKDLKKQKQDEADARKVLEAALSTVRTAKREGDQKARVALANSGKLVTRFRDLHTLSTTLLEQLKPLVADAKALPLVPELDSKMLEEIEEALKEKKE